MSSATSKKRLRRAAAAVAALSALGVVTTHHSAQADPMQFSALKGFGSDTIEQVSSALAGFNNGIQYTPLLSTWTDITGTTQRQQLISWDATPDNQCIQTFPGSPSIHRPNGSGEGRGMLSAADSGVGWGSAGCGGLKNVSGLVDFSRTSSIPGTTVVGGALTYTVLGRDALSFAAYRTAGSPVTVLTTGQLVSLFSTPAFSGGPGTAFTAGPQIIGGVFVVPCGIQSGSGTFSFWNTANGIAATENAATAMCRTTVPGGDVNGRIEENSATALKAKGDALALISDNRCDGIEGGAAVPCTNAQVIIGFSAANYVAKANGVSSGGVPAGVVMGDITGVGTPVNPPVPPSTTWSPNSAFYANTTFGRYVGYIVPTGVLHGPGEVGLKKMFFNGNATIPDHTNPADVAQICTAAAQTTVNSYGFLSDANCGSIFR